MEYQQKILLLLTGILVIFAVYLAVNAQPAVQPEKTVPDDSEARALLMKAMAFGSGLGEYHYAFTEGVDGYEKTYVLTRKPNASLITVHNPLSAKSTYFLQNDTILCIEYPLGSEEVCTSVRGRSDADPYLRTLNATFFSDAQAAANAAVIQYQIGKGYVRLDPEIRNVTGMNCREIRYQTDLSNLSLEDAARFGIGTGDPKVFNWTMCIDDSNGYLKLRKYSYEMGGLRHEHTYKLVWLATYGSGGAPEIAAPAETVPDKAVEALYTEMKMQNTLVACFFEKRGEERDKCVATLALDLKRKDLCELAGARRDRCLVSVVPSTKDTAICPVVQDASFRDDCYTELAGALKNSTWCANVMNQSKVEFCNRVALPKEGNASTSQVDIDKFLQYIDKDGMNKTGNQTQGPAAEAGG